MALSLIQSAPESSPPKAKRWGRVLPTFRYVSRTEVHAFGFAIAASTLLSLVPLLNVMLSLCKYTFKWDAAADAIRFGVGAYLPVDLMNVLRINLRYPKPFEFVSIILLLFTANGIFEPLEVALNRAWGVTKDRSYVKNQLLSFGLILLCGGLALGSFLLTALNHEWLSKAFGAQDQVPDWLLLAIFKLVAIPMIMLALFLTYWLLPNCRVPVSRIAPVAFWVGMAITLLQYVVVLAWPWLIRKMQHDYSPFEHSASIILFSFVAALIVLAGAEWSARPPEELEVLFPEPAAASASPVDETVQRSAVSGRLVDERVENRGQLGPER